MSSKLTKLTESSPSALPPSVICGSSILGQWRPLGPFILEKLMMATRQRKPCGCPGSGASNIRRYLWSKKDGPFGKEFPVSEGPTPDATSGYSDCRGMWKDGPMLENPSQLVVGQSTPAQQSQFPGSILKV
ncbi:hypothetical protein O181_004234 [Austropuccinia psidii MF-1]|uniref:Uncharacterized protein n=1 Tax=Austropuccinia psidii MF-1 TaxID=1389203 RepID=A0A9Q3BFH1_9BASI|nr:hypothetical protein [Austropuccinia psidii MF-1]